MDESLSTLQRILQQSALHSHTSRCGCGCAGCAAPKGETAVAVAEPRLCCSLPREGDSIDATTHLLPSVGLEFTSRWSRVHEGKTRSRRSLRVPWCTAHCVKIAHSMLFSEPPSHCRHEALLTVPSPAQRARHESDRDIMPPMHTTHTHGAARVPTAGHVGSGSGSWIWHVARARIYGGACVCVSAATEHWAKHRAEHRARSTPRPTIKG